MPAFRPRLRLLLLLPTRYDPSDPHAPNEEIEPDKMVAVQQRIAERYGGLTILQPYQPPFVEGWWHAEGILRPPESNRLVDVVTRPLATREERHAEMDWILTQLYPPVKSLLRQQELFLLVQELERVLED